MADGSPSHFSCSSLKLPASRAPRNTSSRAISTAALCKTEKSPPYHLRPHRATNSASILPLSLAGTTAILATARFFFAKRTGPTVRFSVPVRACSLPRQANPARPAIHRRRKAVDFVGARHAVPSWGCCDTKDTMNNSATLEGTKRYANRFAGRAADGHFREAHGLVMSSLGIGTYLGQPDPKVDASYTAAIVAAAESGINFIDAAINYRFQRSERNIGAAIKQLAAKGFSRDELVICTKGGYLTPDGSMPEDPNEYFFREYLQPGVFTAKDIVAGSHCMTPRFLENQLGRSLRNLEIDCIDVYYLHNP